MDDSLRKAAVLIRSLPPEAAATLIGRLSAEEAASLRASIAALGDVDADERSGVADAIRGASSESDQTVLESDGVELRIDSIATPPDAAPPDAAPTDPFRLLKDADPAAIASYLAGEQSRAAALVLSYLDPEVASAVLDEYSDERQAQLLTQMSRLGEADPGTIRIIAADLTEWVRQKGDERRLRSDRLAVVRGVLSATSGERRRRLAARIAKSDPTTAARLGLSKEKPSGEPGASATAAQRKPTPVADAPGSPSPTGAPSPALAFDDLERLDGKDLVAALGRIGGRAAVLALAGASENLLRRVEGALAKKSAKQMRRRIAALGQTTLAEVEASQRALAAEAEKIVVARRVKRVAAMN